MKVSIITPTLNNASTIEDTIKCVLGQNFPDIEYIVVDGESADGTLGIIDKYKSKITRIISEKDNGMYDAMNKGILLATGDIIGILNSDDVYASSSVIAKVASRFQESGSDCVWGDLVYIDQNDPNKIVRDWKSSPYEEGSFQKGWHPPHPAFFVRKDIYKRYGLFRTDLSTSADYELMLRFLEKEKISSSYLPLRLIKMRNGGVSNKSYFNLIKANIGCYKAFKINGLKIDLLFVIRKPLFKLKQFHSSDLFFRRWMIYFTGSMVVAFVNYLFYPVLGRLLPLAEFGDIQALISLITQSLIIFGVFSLISVNIITNTENREERNAVIAELQKIVFWIVGVIFVGVLLFTPSLRTFFNFSTVYPLIGLSIILLISSVTTFKSAYLQGSGRFLELSLSEGISSLGRLVFAASLVLLGFGTIGATFGIVLANILVLIFLFFRTRGALTPIVKGDIHVLEKGSVKKELIYGTLILFVTGFVTIFYTSDILIIKHYFSSIDAGLYSGISAIAKILFFALSPIAAVLLASIKMKNTFAENASILKKAVYLALIVGVVGMGAFYLWSSGIISLMIGGKYVPFAHFLPRAALLMLLSAYVNILAYYFLALRRYFLIVISSVAVILVALVLFWSHASIETVLTELTLVIGAVLFLLLIMYAKDYLDNRSRL